MSYLHLVHLTKWKWRKEFIISYIKKQDRWGLISSTGTILNDAEFLSLDNAQGQYYLVGYNLNHWEYISQKKRMFRE